ncbi:MAG TPA: superoxide dismutase family protein [Azonexus sp.]
MQKIPMLVLAGLVSTLAACQSMPDGPRASAMLEARSASSVAGEVSFTPAGDEMIVRARLSGLKPGGEHGFHVHDKGDCSAADASSAGGHFNPASTAHGHYGMGNHHAGDLPNLKADGEGKAVYEARVGMLALSGANGIVGRSVVVHRDADDYKSQPAGNSGPRIACGVIR